jgi:hypothetical protein
MPCRARPRGESVTVAKSAAEADPRGWGGAYTRPVSVWETGVICKFCCALLFAREPEGPVLYPRHSLSCHRHLGHHGAGIGATPAHLGATHHHLVAVGHLFAHRGAAHAHLGAHAADFWTHRTHAHQALHGHIAHVRAILHHTHHLGRHAHAVLHAHHHGFAAHRHTATTIVHTALHFLRTLHSHHGVLSSLDFRIVRGCEQGKPTRTLVSSELLTAIDDSADALKPIMLPCSFSCPLILHCGTMASMNTRQESIGCSKWARMYRRMILTCWIRRG